DLKSLDIDEQPVWFGTCLFAVSIESNYRHINGSGAIRYRSIWRSEPAHSVTIRRIENRVPVFGADRCPHNSNTGFNVVPSHMSFEDLARIRIRLKRDDLSVGPRPMRELKHIYTNVRAYIETNITGLYPLPQKPRDRGVVILTKPTSLSWINA